MNRLLSSSIFILLLIIAGASWFIFRENFFSPEQTTLLTTVNIDKETISLDTLAYNERRKATFVITNTGNYPLFIRHVETSCGCTHVEWEQQPIPPKRTGKISLTFSPNSLGAFSKTINVFCNTSQRIHALHIKGFVTEE